MEAMIREAGSTGLMVKDDVLPDIVERPDFKGARAAKRKYSDLISGSGVNRDSNGIPIFDPNLDLSQLVLRGFKYDHGQYHRMVVYDGTIRGVFSFISGEILRAGRRLKEMPNRNPQEEAAYRIAELICGLGDDRSTIAGGLTGIIRHACLKVIYGFSLVEIGWGVINHRRMGLLLVPNEAGWIAPWSGERWLWWGRYPLAIVQRAPTEGVTGCGMSFAWDKAKIIPLNKCLLFRYQGYDGNPEGFAMIRSCLPWFNAKFADLYRDQTSAAKLADGLFIVQEEGDENGPWRGNGKKDGERMAKMIQAVKEGRSNRIGVPYGLKLIADWPDYDKPSGLEMMRYYDHMILSCALANILGLDVNASASKGLSDGMSAIAYHMIEGIANEIAEIINGNGYHWSGLIERAVHANIPDYTGRMPSFEFTGIRYVDIKSLIKSLALGAQFRLFTPTVSDEVDIRQSGGLRSLSIDEIKKARDAADLRARGGQADQSGQSQQEQARKPGE